MKWIVLLMALLLFSTRNVLADPWTDEEYMYASNRPIGRFAGQNNSKENRNCDGSSFPQPAAVLFMITGITGILLYSSNVRKR